MNISIGLNAVVPKIYTVHKVDLYAAEDVTIYPGEVKRIFTNVGLRVTMPSLRALAVPKLPIDRDHMSVQKDMRGFFYITAANHDRVNSIIICRGDLALRVFAAHVTAEMIPEDEEEWTPLTDDLEE